MAHENWKHYRLYHAWSNMMARCYGNDPKSYRYKGRGITVCVAWHDWPTFQNWALTHSYDTNLTIERKDNAKGSMAQGNKERKKFEKSRIQREKQDKDHCPTQKKRSPKAQPSG